MGDVHDLVLRRTGVPVTVDAAVRRLDVLRVGTAGRPLVDVADRERELVRGVVAERVRLVPGAVAGAVVPRSHLVVVVGHLVRRVVRERRTRRVRMGAIEQILHVVVRHDPAVVVGTRGLVPQVSRRHGKEIAHGHRAVHCIQRVQRREVRCDRRRRGGEHGVAQRDANEGGYYALGHRADIKQRGRVRAPEVVLPHEPAVTRHEEAAEGGDRGRVGFRGDQTGSSDPLVARAGVLPVLGEIDPRGHGRDRGCVPAGGGEPEAGQADCPTRTHVSARCGAGGKGGQASDSPSVARLSFSLHRS